MFNLNILWALLSSVSVASGLFVYSWRMIPEWINNDDLRKSWRVVNKWSLAVSALLGVVASFLFLWLPLLPYLFNVVAVSALSFVLVQALFSDFKLRLADRRVLNICNALGFVFGIICLLIAHSYVMLVVYVVLLLCLSCLILFPKSIGMSDVRALLMVVIFVFPVGGFSVLSSSLVYFIVALLLYSVVMMFKSRSFKPLIGKQSLPMVPIIVAPFLVALLVSAFNHVYLVVS